MLVLRNRRHGSTMSRQQELFVVGLFAAFDTVIFEPKFRFFPAYVPLSGGFRLGFLGSDASFLGGADDVTDDRLKARVGRTADRDRLQSRFRQPIHSGSAGRFRVAELPQRFRRVGVELEKLLGFQINCHIDLLVQCFGIIQGYRRKVNTDNLIQNDAM